MAKQKSFTVFGKAGKYRCYKYGRTWYVDYHTQGGVSGRKRVSLKTTRREDAETAVHELDLKRWSRHQDALAVEVGDALPVQNPPVTELTSKYVAYCVSQLLAPKTIARYQAALAAFERYCVTLDISEAREITLETLEGFMRYRMSEEVSAEQTAYNDAIIIKSMLKYASAPSRRLLSHNPGTGWKLRKPVGHRRYCFTQDEVDALTGGVRSWLRPVVTCLAYEGLRIGELIHLRTIDVDLKGGFLHVRAREGWKPKGRRDRSVPIHRLVRDELRGRAVGGRLPGEWAFTSLRGKQLKQSYCLDCFTTDRDKLGIAQGTLHSLRHFFVSLCAERGVPMLTCMQWVGHTDTDMVQHYYHLHDGVSLRAMQKLAPEEPAMKILKIS